jgi:toxin ParE1/3/4
MNRILRLRARAELDLDELFMWMVERAARAAARFLDRVKETIDRIVRFPHLATRFVTPKGRNLQLAQIKRYRKYVIVYRLNETEIETLRIVRATRNLGELLDN